MCKEMNLAERSVSEALGSDLALRIVPTGAPQPIEDEDRASELWLEENHPKVLRQLHAPPEPYPIHEE
jgi:hypothetical protein